MVVSLMERDTAPHSLFAVIASGVRPRLGTTSQPSLPTVRPCLGTTSQPSLSLGSSPSRGALGRPSRFRGLTLRSCLPCWRKVLSLRQECVLERQRSLRKMNPMPRPPLLGEVASSEAMMTERFNTVSSCLQAERLDKDRPCRGPAAPISNQILLV